MNMNENLVMVCLGPLLVVFGFAQTRLRGPMPGAEPGDPTPLRMRLIVILFGALMFILGLVRLINE